MLIAVIGSPHRNDSETMGSNIEIKIADYDAENRLIGIIEPLNVFSMLLGEKYNKEKIDFIWKNLLKTHAHDSIHGSGDPHIKIDNLNRLEQISEMENYLHMLICRLKMYRRTLLFLMGKKE